MTKEEQRAKNQAYYAANKARIIAQHVEYRAGNPDLVKTWTKRYRTKNRESLRLKVAAYDAAHAEERREYRLRTSPQNKARCAKRYAEKRPADIANRAAHRAEPEARLKARAVSAAWRAAHPGWYVAWCKRNPDKARIIWAKRWNKRRALKLGNTIGTDRKAYRAFIRIIKTAERLPCYWCGKMTLKGNRHADHIIALNIGGPDDVHNLCCACPHCNISKRDKRPEDFSGQFVLQFA